MRILTIIPARLGSNRFPNKLLRKINGKSILQRVSEACEYYTDATAIATDSDEIMEEAHGFGAEVIKTTSRPKNGTERCFEAISIIQATEVPGFLEYFDFILNVQADQPLLRKEHFIPFYENGVNIKTGLGMHTLITPYNTNMGDSVFACMSGDRAIYFSRSKIPNNSHPSSKKAKYKLYKHIGIYAFNKLSLQYYGELQQSTLEQVEQLEQLRWIENNIPVWGIESPTDSPSVDHPSDIQVIKELINYS